MIEGPETIRISLRGTSPYTVNPATLTIADNEPAVVNLVARAVKCQPTDARPNSNHLGEADGKVCFELSGAFPAGVFPVSPVTVRDLTFTGGTAAQGTDFTAAFPAAGRKTITLGTGNPTPVTTARVDITAVDDSTMNEGCETIVIEGTAAGYTVRSVAVLLYDNDPSPNRIDLKVDADSSLEGYQPSVGEGVSSQTITVTAAYADRVFRTSDTSITVSVASAAGTRAAEANDFTAVSDFTITIPAHNNFGSGTFTLTTASDDIAEGPEDLAVSGTASGFTVNEAVVTIDDDDAPSAIVLSVDADDNTVGTQSSVGEGSGAKTARVTASVPGGQTFESAVSVTVSVEGAGGEGEAEAADFTAVEDFTVTITAGQSSGSAAFSLDPTDDDYAEGAEDITVSGASGFPWLRVTGASVEITDNDDPPASVALSVDLDGNTPGDQNTIGEGDAAASAEVTAAFPANSKTFESDTVITVTVEGDGTVGKAESSDFSTDKTNDTFDITIPAGAAHGSASFTLTVADDEVSDVIPETITVSGVSDRTGLAVASGAVTINADTKKGRRRRPDRGGREPT